MVKHIFRLFLIGYSPKAIANILMDNGVPTARGNLRWSYDTVEKKILNELRRYTPSTGWLSSYNSNIQRALQNRRHE